MRKNIQCYGQGYFVVYYNHGISRVSKLSNIPVQLSGKKNTTYVGKWSINLKMLLTFGNRLSV